MSLLAAVAAAQNGVVPFDSEWKLGGDARVAEINNQQMMVIGTGIATLEDAAFKDGTIEVDFQTTGHRAFVYLIFRIAEGGNREEMYLRSHKSNLPDALQYTPVIRGVSQWQIFHGDAGTAAVALPAEQWSRLRVEMKDRKLAIFVGAGEAPDLVVSRLTHVPVAGGIALRSFIPNGSEAPFGVRFRNLRVHPNRTTFDFDSVPTPLEPNTGVLREWEVSTVFAASEKLYDQLPEVDDQSWWSVDTEPNGVVLLHRLERPQGTRSVGTVVRHRIESSTATTRSLDLGFSDAVSVFLNGKPIVGLDQSYRFDKPRVQGVLGLHQSRIYLPLEAGVNDLQIVVTDSFGGWGIVGKWAD